jgi:hypothetical protein
MRNAESQKFEMHLRVSCLQPAAAGFASMVIDKLEGR